MKLGELIDFCGNLLDYDPTNTTYREQLVSLLNDAQQRVLVDRHWAFAQRERALKVYTDATATVTLTNGSATVTGTFTVSSDRVLPGGTLELAEVKITLASGGYAYRQLRWIENGTTAYLDRVWDGATGAYEVTYRRREVYLLLGRDWTSDLILTLGGRREKRNSPNGILAIELPEGRSEFTIGKP